MLIRETKSAEEIKTVLCHPEIYDRISDDYSITVEEFEPPMDAEYIAGYVGNDIIGLMIYHINDGKLECHFQVLPEFRQYSKEFARMALEIGKAKNASIYAEIPDCYPEVIKFTTNFGFNIVGNIVDGHQKNGQSCDVKILRFDNGIL